MIFYVMPFRLVSRCLCQFMIPPFDIHRRQSVQGEYVTCHFDDLQPGFCFLFLDPTSADVDWVLFIFNPPQSV